MIAANEYDYLGGTGLSFGSYISNGKGNNPLSFPFGFI